MDDQGIPTVMGLVADLAHARGVHSIKDAPGCHQMPIDKEWTCYINPHPEPCPSNSGHPPGDLVPPHSMLFLYNGWPAGLVNAAGGAIAAGEEANEATLSVALRKATREAESA